MDTIEAFLNNSSDKWSWDNFTSCSLHSAKLDRIRRRVGAVDLPLDTEGEATLRALQDEAKRLTETDLMKPKPWRMATGVMGGVLVGALLWWNNHVPGADPFQNLQLLLIPVAIGITVVSWRNKRKKVGPYDPEIVALNKRGRV